MEGHLAEIEAEVLRLFPDVVATFKSGDEDEARRLMRTYKKDISKEVTALEKMIVSGKVELSSADSATIVLYARFLKRISAHSRNLVSSLVNPFPRIGYSE